ncbi:MAG: metallophosphoesterase [Planctomycetota bacterium]|nr:metallophosphoesterase [Planctomycetota bacterium]
MRLAWMTDIHLNFLEAINRGRFLETARDQADAFVISGDIAESPSITGVLTEMADVWQKPIHFVLGNHDFYRGSIGKTRFDVASLAHQREFLTYLTATGVVELSPQTAIVGHDGWADARLGDFEGSDVILNDYVLIEELGKWKGRSYLDKPALREALNVLGDEAARHFEVVLKQAVAQYPSVIAVTHVPPFKEAAWYDGRHSDDNYLPHFACKATGDVMRNIMEANPQSRLLVLCGHTHGSGEVQILENLQVLTGGAEYGHPAIQRIFDIG